MTILSSQLLTSTPEYRANREAYLQLIEELQQNSAKIRAYHSDSAVELARSRNKLLVDERIEHLIDRNAPVLELGALAGLNVGETPAGCGLRTCISKVAGRTCMIIANDPLAKGGTYFPLTVKKHLRAQEIARENRLPCIYLVDSGGAFLPLQADVFPDRFHFGRIFYNQAVMSAEGIPQISAVLGSCTAGGAYVPAMSEETIMVRGNASIFLGGPPLVKAATGEEVSAEELGGAKVHCEISGVADHLAEDELHALALTRERIRTLGEGTHPVGWRPLSPSQPVEDPRYDPYELYGLVGTDLRRAVPVVEILARLLDGSRFSEFKARYGTTIKCGFGHIMGYQVGIIANDGILFSESALKATHFIELCNQRLIPLLFVQNIVGFMVGKEYEHGGIAKDGAKMVTAVASARVPKFTLTVGGSFGAGNYSMCGRAYDPRFLFTWPNSRISVMGGMQAATVLTQVRRASLERRQKEIDEASLTRYHEEILEKYEAEGSPYYATARLWDDGIIDPVKTREVLGLALAASGFAGDNQTPFGLFRM